MKIRKHLLCVVFTVIVASLLSSCTEMTIWSENWKSLDIYGKVVDQYGDPVVAAKVEGSILLNVSLVKSGGETHFTQTDSQGFFNFLGIHGVKIGVLPQKDGYYYNPKLSSQRPPNYSPDPNNPVVFPMWKIRGTEPLVRSAINADLSPEGKTVILDTTTGKQTPDGDLRITFFRFPLEIKPGLVHPYDWRFKIEMVNGGLAQESDPYPYWAPESGYQALFGFEMNSNSNPWQNQFEQNFYIKNSNGRYGLMKFLVYSASKQPQVQINFTINPSGSQNLEPDFSK